jgi:hypothetical protein
VVAGVASNFASAHEYLRWLSRAQEPWETLYAAYLTDPTLTVAAGLVHPMWYAADEGVAPGDPRGPRRFPDVNDAASCRAVRIWAYDCDLELGGTQRDHVFPFSAGGPTEARNLIHLCPWHNQVKGSDVHVFPWTEGIPPWMDDHLKRIALRREVLRRTRP